MTHRQAYGLLLGVALLWAGNYPLAKIGLSELGPITMSALRALLAAPLLVLVSRLVEGPLPPLARRDLTTVVVLAVSGFVGNSALWYVGLRGTSPANAGILSATSPVVVALAAATWLRERISPLSLAGSALTVLAVALTVAQGSVHVLLTLSVNRGDVIILLSQSLWVGYTLYSRANRSTFSPLQVLAGAHVVAAGLLAPLALVERPWQAFAQASRVGFSVVLYTALLGTPAHIAYYHAVRTVGPSRAAVFMNLIPFLVLGLSWLMLGEPIRWYHWVGAIGVIAGVVLTTRRARPPAPARTA
ncbi:MAG TPA: DMT family transporter [Methylomirabilota bacterium]|nr:DMT family transporter [Methylomirabilota bacterium]